MSQVSMKQLLEAGVHFGHQSRRWNPKMAPYIYTDRNGIYIIDLKKTLRLLRDAARFVRETVAAGGKVLFVGTKKQAREIIAEGAEAAGMYYINSRWLGGLMTNFQTVRLSVLRLIALEKMFEDGTIEKYSKKEQSMLNKERQSLSKNLGGIKGMATLPDLMFVIDPQKEAIAIKEANKLGIPVVAVVDTNCDPDPVQFVIPGNDDAIRSIKLMVGQISDSCIEGLASREQSADGSDASAFLGQPMSAKELEERFEVYSGEPKAEEPAGPAEVNNASVEALQNAMNNTLEGNQRS